MIYTVSVLAVVNGSAPPSPDRALAEAAIQQQAAARPQRQPMAPSMRYFLEHATLGFSLPGGTNMKSILSLSIAGLLSLSASVFAAPQTAPAATPPATSATTTTTTTQPAPVMKETPAQRKAERKQIKADEKTALAECKKLKGAERKTCRQQAEAKEKAAMVDLKAKK
jgi:hypothetical protein